MVKAKAQACSARLSQSTPSGLRTWCGIYVCSCAHLTCAVRIFKYVGMLMFVYASKRCVDHASRGVCDLQTNVRGPTCFGGHVFSDPGCIPCQVHMSIFTGLKELVRIVAHPAQEYRDCVHKNIDTVYGEESVV